MLYWLTVDWEEGMTEEEEEEGQQGMLDDDAMLPLEGMAGAWGLVGELMGM